MKKKNLLWSLLTMMMVAVLSAGFVACGSDDDDDDSSSSSGVVGTWSGTFDGDQLTVICKKGGTGTWTYRYNDSYSGTETYSGSFTYVMENETEGIATVRFSDESGNYTERYYFEIEGTKMYVEIDGDEFVLRKQ